MPTRDDEAKAIRRVLGDNVGVEFLHGTYSFMGEYSNTIDSVLKDNLVLMVSRLTPSVDH